jgi:hypothetical protein
MRLLETTTYVLSEFQGQIPAYAILSHVWEKEEVTFSDIATLNKAAEMKGFTKIVGACEEALKDGLKYIWIDTCCINKESSAELSEAINSMFIWYKNAHICYAYLSDMLSDEDPDQLYSSFAMSRWFTRGWTLQELLAPLRVVFYGADWVDIGTKGTLRETISTVTGISVEVLVGVDKRDKDFTLDRVPVAVRMSWASYRQTTREEDMAYSLMGLFGVNMPLLYGEGMKAFIRLQHEIIRMSDDHSIFAFTGGPGGILASSPSQFRQSSQVKLLGQSGQFQTPYSMTNKGLHIQLPLRIIIEEGMRGKKTLAFLNCYLDDESKRLAITLTPSHGESCYSRSNTSELQFGIPSGWMLEHPFQPLALSSIYIVDGDDSTAPHAESGRVGDGIIQVTATVPAEYGQIKLAMSDSERCTPNYLVIEKDGKSGDKSWFAAASPGFDPDGVMLLLSNASGSDKFGVVLGTRSKHNTMWCSVQCPPITLSQMTESERQHFLDRSSTTLNDGWVVTVKCGTQGAAPPHLGAALVLYAKIEIKRAPTPQDSPMPQRPTYTHIAWMVIPPAPHHGYIVETSSMECVPLRGSFIVYTQTDPEFEDYCWATAVPFTCSSSERPLHLLLGSTGVSGPPGSSLATAVWEPDSSFYGEGRTLKKRAKALGTPYNINLEGGDIVYVDSWRSRDTSLADYVVKLSM